MTDQRIVSNIHISNQINVRIDQKPLEGSSNLYLKETFFFNHVQLKRSVQSWVIQLFKKWLM